MIRPVLAYSLTAIILLVQTGLPLHIHYCKGMLESVSLFAQSKCDDHMEAKDIFACCKKWATECGIKDNCCDDEVAVLLQDFDSLLPHFDKWEALSSFTLPLFQWNDLQAESDLPVFAGERENDTGPPIYILFHALIYYA